MTCSECQIQIFDGDLNRDAVVHLTACEECRALDLEVRLNAAALSVMKDDVMPAQTVQRRPTRYWLPWVAAAAALVAAFGLTYKPSAPVPVVTPPVIAEYQPEVAEPALPIPDPPRPVRSRPRPQPALAKPAPREATEPLMVKFLTDDPDIVIYWLIEAKGEQAI
ncbi:MAG: hypothetical protein ABI995_12195 [Acidobacteriota bacterium]